MACEDCPVAEALELSKQVVDNNSGGAFSEKTQDAKRKEFMVRSDIIAKAQTGCDGPVDKDGTPVCGKLALINNAVHFVLSKPDIWVDGRGEAGETENPVGFTPRVA